MHRDGDLTGADLAQIVERVGRLLRPAQRVDRKRVERLAGLGQLGTAAALAVEQRLPDLGFERADVRPDRRLGDAELGRRGIEAAEVDDALEHREAARACGNHRTRYL